MNYFKFKNCNRYNLSNWLMKCSSMKEIHLKIRAWLIINQSILKVHKNFRTKSKTTKIFRKLNLRPKRTTVTSCLMKYHLDQWDHQKIVTNAGLKFFRITYKVRWYLYEIKLLKHRMKVNSKNNYLLLFVTNISICILKITKLSLSVSLMNSIIIKKHKTLLSMEKIIKTSKKAQN